MTNCNDPRKKCGEIISSNCLTYEGTKPDFLTDDEFPCDVNVTDIIQDATDKIDEILDDNNLTSLNKQCLDFVPATVTIKGLHQVEIDAICAAQAQIDTLQDTLDNLDISDELITIDLGDMTPLTNPCSATTNTYSLYYILSTLVENVNLIKTNLGL